MKPNPFHSIAFLFPFNRETSLRKRKTVNISDSQDSFYSHPISPGKQVNSTKADLRTNPTHTDSRVYLFCEIEIRAAEGVRVGSGRTNTKQAASASHITYRARVCIYYFIFFVLPFFLLCFAFPPPARGNTVLSRGQDHPLTFGDPVPRVRA